MREGLLPGPKVIGLRCLSNRSLKRITHARYVCPKWRSRISHSQIGPFSLSADSDDPESACRGCGIGSMEGRDDTGATSELTTIWLGREGDDSFGKRIGVPSPRFTPSDDKDSCRS